MFTVMNNERARNTANTYTRFLTDEAELDYEALIRARTTHTPMHTQEVKIAR